VTPATHRLGATIVVLVGLVGTAGGFSTNASGDSSSNAGQGDEADSSGVWLDADAGTILEASSQAMHDVTSVSFVVERTGEPLFVDGAKSLALDRIAGRFDVTGGAEALVTVTIDDNLVTDLGAVAVGADIWLSNPITGEFESLPPGYNLDPRTFFDPVGGWAPLLRDLQEPVLVDVDGDRYVIDATATAVALSNVTAGLVDDEGTLLRLWVNPVSGLVTRLHFEVQSPGRGISTWVIELSDYGVGFEIDIPAGVDQ